MPIKKCDCKNEFQTKMYGKNNRVFNKTIKKPHGNGGFHCTSCGKYIDK